ncbi:hypothetical protein RUND412_002395 [Rhizina undulata]
MAKSQNSSVPHLAAGSKINKKKKRHASVYDAVASRVNYEGFIQSNSKDKHGNPKRRRGQAVPADEVLGRRKNAPKDGIPYVEDDRLPDTDLLTAIHQYAADFYAKNGMGDLSYKSLDETALLAFGILLEQAVKFSLGADGDLVLIEQPELEVMK